MALGLTRALRERGVDVDTVQEEGRRGQSDTAQLEWATQHGRVIYTKNAGDFQRLHANYLAASRHHAGIVVLTKQGYTIGDQLRGLLALITQRSAEEMIDVLEFVSNWR
jgi:uncharacterized protein with PIN domain